MLLDMQATLELIKANDKNPERGEIVFDPEGSNPFKRVVNVIIDGFDDQPNYEAYVSEEEWDGNGLLRKSVWYTDEGKEGVWEYWYRNGQMESREVVVNYLSTYEQWDDNGTMRCRVENKNLGYLSSSYHGLSEYWYKDGQLQERANYIDGKKHGLFEKYRKNTHKLAERATYKNDKLDGVHEYFYDNGEYEMATYKDGEKNGLYEYYFKNGQIKERCHYTEADFLEECGKVLEGLHEAWYENGQKKYESNLETGEYKSWTKDGELRVHEQPYKQVI